MANLNPLRTEVEPYRTFLRDGLRHRVKLYREADWGLTVIAGCGVFSKGLILEDFEKGSWECSSCAPKPPKLSQHATLELRVQKLETVVSELQKQNRRLRRQVSRKHD